MTEHALQCQVAEYLDAVLDPSVFWTSIGHGGGGKIRGAQLKRAGVKPGVPDIYLSWVSEHQLFPRNPVRVGHTGWIELKTRAGRVSPIQSETSFRLSKLGHYFAVCRSLDDVIGTLKAWGVGTREAKQVAA